MTIDISFHKENLLQSCEARSSVKRQVQKTMAGFGCGAHWVCRSCENLMAEAGYSNFASKTIATFQRVGI